MHHILVIDDEPALLSEIEECLQLEGYRVSTARNGHDGIEKAIASPPDLVISDISMPEASGYDVLKALQQRPELESIPFIFLTARADTDSMRHGMDMGADDYITKPFSVEQLLSAIQARLKRYHKVTSALSQRTDQIKRQLISVVSHELNTPLISLAFVREVVEQQVNQLDKDDTMMLFDMVRDGTNRLEHLIKQTITLSQITAGTLTPAMIQRHGRPIQMSDLISASINTARRYAFRNQAGVIETALSDDSLLVWGDSQYLEQALAEVLANALNFSPETQQVTLTSTHSEAYVWITIQDQGCGIPLAELEKAQRPFEQIERERSEQQGMGLGLAVTRSIIDCHEGTFEIHSVEQHGTQVTIALRRCSP